MTAVASDIAGAGFQTVWTPPAQKGFAGVHDMGYGLTDYFDLGEFSQIGAIRTRHTGIWGASGVYLYRLEAESFVATRKLALTK